MGLNGEADFRATFDWLANPMFAFQIDSGFRVVCATPSFHQMLGYPVGGLVGIQLHELLDSQNSLNAKVLNANNVWARELFHGQQLVFLTGTGAPRVVSLQASALNADGVMCAIGRDITQQHLAESELHARFEKLESALSQLSTREKVVLDSVVQGQLNKSIATQLDVTVRAVERIRARLRKKFMAQSSAEVVALATEYSVLLNIVSKNRLPEG